MTSLFLRSACLPCSMCKGRVSRLVIRKRFASPRSEEYRTGEGDAGDQIDLMLFRPVRRRRLRHELKPNFQSSSDRRLLRRLQQGQCWVELLSKSSGEGQRKASRCRVRETFYIAQTNRRTFYVALTTSLLLASNNFSAVCLTESRKRVALSESRLAVELGKRYDHIFAVRSDGVMLVK